MERRTVGTTDLEVTRFGLGTAPLGGLYSPVADEDAFATMQQAYPQAGLGLALDIGAKVNKGEMAW